MPEVHPILVTGATGNIGSRVVSQLPAQGVPVRALVQHDDDSAADLRAMGDVQTVVGDLTRAPDVVAALDACRRLYFGMAVSPYYLEAAATVAVAARDGGSVEMLVNMSQMTVSQMGLHSTTESRQQRMQWLAEHVLNWSGLPVTHVRPTVFMENPLFGMVAVASIERDDMIRLPFGDARTSPVAARDVAEVVARLDDDLTPLGLPPHVQEHIATMARLHKENRYDRVTSDISDLLGRPPSGFDSLISETPALQPASQ